MTDTQGVNVLGAYAEQEQRRRGAGNAPAREALRTPCLDRLAAQGITFDRCYTTTPLCTPARAGLFTGRYSHSVGAWANNLALAQNFAAHGAALPRRRLPHRLHRQVAPGRARLLRQRRLPGRLGRALLVRRHALPGRPLRRRPHLLAPGPAHHRGPPRARRAGPNSPGGTASPTGPSASWKRPPGSPAAVPAGRLLRRARTAPSPAPRSTPSPSATSATPWALRPFDDLRDKPRYQQAWAAASRQGARARPRRSSPATPSTSAATASWTARSGAWSTPSTAWRRTTPGSCSPATTGTCSAPTGLQSKACAVYEEIAHIPLIVRPPAGAAPARRPAGRPGPDRTPRHPRAHAGQPHRRAAHVPGPGRAPRAAGAGGHQPGPRPARGARAIPTAPSSSSSTASPPRAKPTGASTPCAPSSRATTSWRSTCWTRTSCTTSAADPTECRNLIDDPGAAGLRDALHDQLIDWQHAVRDPFRGPAWERRPWRQRPPRLTHSGGWQGQRLGREDGYSAPYTQEDPFAVRRWSGRPG